MEKTPIFLIFLTVLAGTVGASQPVLATSLPFSGFCAGERLIYAQDINGVTPGSDADTAFINNRNFNRLATVSQISDDYVIWPATILVNVNPGDTLLYRALGTSGSLDFDVLDSNRQLLRRAIFGPGTPSASLSINQDGFLRFNAGSRADEYNLLVLCPAAAGGGGGQPTPGNRVPVFAQIGPFNVFAGQNLQFQIFATDPDGDQVFYSASNLPSGAAFNSTSRTFNWFPTGSQVGSFVVVFRAFDSNGGQAALNVSIVVQPSSQPIPGGRPPVWSQISSQIVTVGQTLQFTVQAFDPDGDVLTYSAPQLPSGSDFNVTSRVFTWSPSASQVGSQTVQFRVSDSINNVDMFVSIAVQQQFFGQIYNPIYQPIYQPSYQPTYQPGFYPYGGTAYAAGVIYGANQPPVWAQTPDQRISVGQTLQFTVFAYDSNGDYLVFQAFNVPSGAVFNQATRTFFWTPVSESQTGLYPVSFRVSDGINSIDMTVAITVSARTVAYLPAVVTPIFPPVTPAPTITYTPPATPVAPLAKLAEPMPPVKVLPWFWVVIILLLLLILLLVILLWRVYRQRQEVVVI